MKEGFGAFGKIPSLGDFFQISPPANFVRAWDKWLQQGILYASDSAAQSWKECYFSAPIWRFTLTSGPTVAHDILGVLMPSVDRVGREFPLTLMARIDVPMSMIGAHFCFESVFEQLEVLALDALNDDMTRERLAERLGEIEVPEMDELPKLISSPNSCNLSAARNCGFLPSLASAVYSDKFDAPCVFSCLIEDGPRLMICENLPDNAHFLGMFDLNDQIWTEV